MTNPDLINLDGLSTLFGVPRGTLSNALSQFDGFPPGKQQRPGGKFYNLAAVRRWAKGKDVAAMARQINARRWHESRTAQTPNQAFNAGCRRFISGEFLPAQQKQQIEFKRLVARTTQPKTQTQHLVFDWMLDEGPNAKDTRSAA